MDIKIGDIVKLVSERPDGWNNYGEMDRFLDSIQTISNVCGTNNKLTFNIIDGKSWVFSLNDIVKVLNNEQQLSNSDYSIF